MKNAIALALCGFLASSSTQAAAQSIRPGPDAFVSHAVFADGRLWLLSDDGALSSIVEGQDVRRDAGLRDPALDVCVQEGQLKAITCTRKGCRNWRLHSWVSGKWSTDAVVPTRGNAFVGLSCAPDKSVVLTSRRLIEISAGRQVAVVLSDKLHGGAIASVHGTSDHVFLGINNGEFGGGLWRIDRRGGKVVSIEKNGPALCEGPLNPSCDPVNGIATEPWKPDCIAVAIGLVHLISSHGRIVEVCSNDVRRIYVRPLGQQTSSAADARAEPADTVAFFGLTRVGNELVAAGVDGVYRIDASGKARVMPLPKFKEIGRIAVSFDVPDVVLVLTVVNQRHSVSGSVPLLVSR